MNSRVLSFANSAVAIQWDGALPARLVDFLFHHIPEASVQQPHVTFTVSIVENGEKIQVESSTPNETRSGTYGEIALYLMERVSYHLADQSRGGLLFHAACLYLDGKALLLAGSSGAGKSSLSTWLANQGFRCLTDEMVFLPDSTLACVGFTRPVHLKPPVETQFPWLLENASAMLRAVPTNPPGWLIPLEALGAQKHAPHDTAPPILHGIVFPCYRPGAIFQFERLSKASAAVALAGMLVNARNLPDHGFPQLLRLARAVPAYHMVYSSFEPIGKTLHYIL